MAGNAAIRAQGNGRALRFPGVLARERLAAGCRPLGKTDFRCGTDAHGALNVTLAELKRRNVFGPRSTQRVRGCWSDSDPVFPSPHR